MYILVNIQKTCIITYLLLYKINTYILDYYIALHSIYSINVFNILMLNYINLMI